MYVLILIYHFEYVHILILRYIKGIYMKILKISPIFKIYYDYTIILVYENKYVHIFYVRLHTQCIYHRRCSNMITYSMYILFIGSDTSYMMRYTCGCICNEYYSIQVQMFHPIVPFKCKSSIACLRYTI